jgi:hypothetical protein
MVYRIAGEIRNGGGSVIATAASAKAALDLARQWAQQGVRDIMITNPHGELYDLDGFGRIASRREEGMAWIKTLRRPSH